MILTITTCKRPSVFKQTVASFSILNDFEAIKEVHCFDDGSSEEELEIMRDAYDAVWHLRPADEQGGHAQSMRRIWDFVTKSDEDFHFQCEDDWSLIRRGCPLIAAMSVLLENPRVGQVCLGRRDLAFAGLYHTSGGTSYTIRPAAFGHENLNCFTLNPCVMRISALKDVGNFEDVPGFENAYGARWNANGWMTADLFPGWVEHAGIESAYTIQGKTR